MPGTLRLIYVGDDLYLRSGTQLSSIYTVDYVQMDWSMVGAALKNGTEVTIVPATSSQRQYVIDRWEKCSDRPLGPAHELAAHSRQNKLEGCHERVRHVAKDCHQP